jgi:hypothetical protein
VAICHGFGLFVAVAVGANISILTGLFYWVAQLLGAIVGSVLVQYCTGAVRNLVPLDLNFPAETQELERKGYTS